MEEGKNKKAMVSFQYVSPTFVQKDIMQRFRDKFQKLSEEINDAMNDSRGRALALTKLEESAFWLNKAITNND